MLRWLPLLFLLVPNAEAGSGYNPGISSGTATAVACTTAGCIDGTEILDNTVGVVDLVQAAQNVFLCQKDSGTGNIDQCTQAEATAALAPATSLLYGTVKLGVETPRKIRLTGDVSDSGGTSTAISDLQFTPDASSTYRVDVYGSFTAAATTTGLQYLINIGNATGSTYLMCRGASGTAEAILVGTADNSTHCLGASSGSGETPFFGWTTFTTTGSPTAVQMFFRTEVAASQVTLKANETYLLVTKLN